MKVKPRLRTGLLAALLAALLTGTPVEGQSPPPAPSGEYEIEFVVFRYAGSDVGSQELPPVVASGHDLLPEPSLRLGGVARTLTTAAGYPVIAQFGWRQAAAASRATARALWLPVEANRPRGLSGSVRLFRQQDQRLIEVNLDWRGPDGTVRIRDVRKLAGRGLLYFDHAEFGALVRVTALAPSPS